MDASVTTVLSYWLLQVIAMGVTALVLPGLRITGISGPFLMVLGLAVVNATIWDAALFFSVPDSFSTHALVLLGANALVFWLLVKLLPGIESDGLIAALLAPVIFTVLSMLITTYARDIDWISLTKSVTSTVEDGRDLLKEQQSGVERRGK